MKLIPVINTIIYKHSLKSNEAPKFLCFEGAFHGRTLYALSLTDMPYDLASTEAFRNAVPTPLRVPFPTNHEQVLRSLDIIEILFQQFEHSLAGLIIEPMLSAGGNLTSTPYFFQQLSELCHSYNVPIIFDEVQTAGGQTGTMWMVDQFDLPHAPDCVVSAKKFGCGVLYMKEPLPEEVLDSTWSGSLVDMVRVPHEFSVVTKDKLIDKVPEKAAYLVAGLKKLQVKFPDIIHTIDGVGLYQGFSLASVELRRKLITSLLHNYNTLILGAGIYSVRVRPPLTVSAVDIANFLTKLELALKDL